MPGIIYCRRNTLWVKKGHNVLSQLLHQLLISSIFEVFFNLVCPSQYARLSIHSLDKFPRECASERSLKIGQQIWWSYDKNLVANFFGSRCICAHVSNFVESMLHAATLCTSWHSPGTAAVVRCIQWSCNNWIQVRILRPQKVNVKPACQTVAHSSCKLIKQWKINNSDQDKNKSEQNDAINIVILHIWTQKWLHKTSTWYQYMSGSVR